MARDYAKKTKPTKAATRGSSRKKRKPTMQRKGTIPVLWMVAGLLIGLFVACLIYLKSDHGQPLKAKIKSKIAKVLKHEKQPSKKIETQPKFDFYTLLPKEKVWVPKADEKPIAAPKEPSAPIAYILQVASFKNHAAAENLKSELASKGYSVHIKPADNAGWIKVWLGPYQNISKAQSAQVHVFESNNLSGLILKVEEK